MKDPNLSRQGRDFDVYLDDDESQFPWTEARWPLVVSILLMVALIAVPWLV